VQIREDGEIPRPTQTRAITANSREQEENEKMMMMIKGGDTNQTKAKQKNNHRDTIPPHEKLVWFATQGRCMTHNARLLPLF